MADPTETEFPKGNVAKTLRAILNQDLKSQDVETISVVLFAHLVLEDYLSRIFYAMLVNDMPRKVSGCGTEGEQQAMQVANQRMEDKIWEKARDTSFIKKLEYFEPCLKEWFPELPTKIRELNRVRNSILHGKKINEVVCGDHSIWSEKGIEMYFLDAQSAGNQLNKFHEMIDNWWAASEKDHQEVKPPMPVREKRLPLE